jgi:hypothetical protein
MFETLALSALLEAAGLFCFWYGANVERRRQAEDLSESANYWESRKVFSLLFFGAGLMAVGLVNLYLTLSPPPRRMWW